MKVKDFSPKRRVVCLFICLITESVVYCATIGGLKYVLYESTHEAMVDNGNNWSGELIIPSVVNHNGQDYRVTSISWLGFDGCNSLTKVTIPKTVKEIYHYAHFADCKNPFIRCMNLESIEVEEGNQWMCSIDGVLFDKNVTKLYSYPAGSRRESYTIPESVRYLYRSSFSECPYLASIQVPETVVSIASATFKGCTSLQEVNLPKSLNTLGAFLFWGCKNLKAITIPSAITSIGEQSFMGCSNLTSIKIPEGVESVGSLAFSGCTALRCVVLPSTISEISSGMFSGCVNLNDVTIPWGVTRVATGAFQNCTSLKKIDLPESISFFLSHVFKGCIFEALIVRGIFDEVNLNKSVFDGMSEKTTIYVQPSEISKFKKIFFGSVLPLSFYNSTEIEPVASQHDNITIVYDLQGQQLRKLLSKGIYIRNGVKVVMK